MKELLRYISNKIGKEELAGIGAIVGFYSIIRICPIRFMTGISCAGCGMTRAWLSLFRLDIPAAFHYHPLFWLPALAVFLFLFKRKVLEKWFWVGVLLFLVIYGVRMISGQDEIVVFRPTEGFLYQMITRIWRG